MMRSTLHFTCSGKEGHPTVLFLHGFLGSGSDWGDVVARLSDRFYCVTIDLPGHGGSVELAQPSHYTFQGAAAAVLGILRSLHVRRPPMLVGYSMGGRLALALALHTANTFRGVVLESASPGLRTDAERSQRALEDHRVADEVEAAPMDEFVDRWYRMPLFASLASRPGMMDALKATRCRQQPAELARALRGMSVGRQPSYWERLPRLSVPTLTIAGEQDEKYVDLGGEMAGLCQRGLAVIVPDAGHNVHLERPDAFVRIVDDFFT